MAFQKDNNTQNPPASGNLKAPQLAKLTPERDAPFQKAIKNVTPVATSSEDMNDERRQAAQWSFLNIFGWNKNKEDVTSDVSPLLSWIDINKDELGQGFDKNQPTDMAYAEFKRANKGDDEITARYESEQLLPHYRTAHASSSRTTASQPLSRFSVIDDGFKAPKTNLPANEARTELATDIRKVSKMYAAEAGMSEKDFAKVLGGIATIESRFGVLRSVSGTKYASSAGGAFHYLDGTIAAEVKQSMNDPRIASRVAELGVNVKDGVKKSEAYTLKEDNILAGSILAKQIVETARKHPELKNDITELATRIYQSHNLGEAGAKALAQGGRSELERVSSKADDNNPMFFKGAKSDEDVNNRYSRFVSSAIVSASPLIETAFAGQASPSVVLASKDRKMGYPAPEPT
jgi:hypothetical protein